MQVTTATLGYGPPSYPPYPKSLCTSINHQVCHGISNDKPLKKKGDIVNLDVTGIKDGWHGDSSRMFLVGERSIAAKRLCHVTYEAMWQASCGVKPGARLAILGLPSRPTPKSTATRWCANFGYGIGRKFHEEPQVMHYGRPGTMEELKPGMLCRGPRAR